ncbi:MAG: hypothetical protein RIQ53_3164 [Pseudomonadota bacterium]
MSADHPSSPLDTRHGSAPVATDDVAGLRVSVRELCAFAARRGDLDLRHTPAPTAAEGIAGHQRVAAARGPDYRAEWPLHGRWQALVLRGRADGWDPGRQRLEEIKTHRMPGRRRQRPPRPDELLAWLPERQLALHRAQLRVYGALLCRAEGLAQVELALVYLDLVSGGETLIVETRSADALEDDLAALCAPYQAWARLQAAHRRARDAALSTLPFVHGTFRDGQQLLARQVFTAARRRGLLLAQAPTGTGKTQGLLYPALRACADQGLDKILALSTRNTGRTLWLQALAANRARSRTLPLRVLELVAREQACLHPQARCEARDCPLAVAFFDKLPAARADALARCDELAGGAGGAAGAGGTTTTAQPVLLDAATLRTIAEAHALCPYYLAQELVRWADVVVADCHQWLDASALVVALTQENDWQMLVLADEAHNLVDRARGMYSAELDLLQWRALAREAPTVLQRPIRRLLGLLRGGPGTPETPDRPAPAEPTPGRLRPAPDDTGGVRHTGTLPAGLGEAIAQVSGVLGDALADPEGLATPAGPWRPDGRWQQAWLELAGFARLAERHDAAHTLVEWQGLHPLHGPARLALVNAWPAPFLRTRWTLAHGAVLCSATLAPPRFHADLLGLPEDHAWLDLPSPFDPAHLQVHRVSGLPMHWRARQAAAAPLARLMDGAIRRNPGNYLTFFSSFEQLDQVWQAWEAEQDGQDGRGEAGGRGGMEEGTGHEAAQRGRPPPIEAWRQHRRMDEAAREAFLHRFRPDGVGLGFAVLGGAFGEGVDLPGRRLIGAFIATLGLPRIDARAQALCERLQAAFGERAGRDYAYTVPGLRKVVQAAGRVIRGPEDRGQVWLIDERWQRRELLTLLPASWQPRPLALHDAASADHRALPRDDSADAP